MMLHLLINI